MIHRNNLRSKVKPETKARAKEFRKNQTDAEKALWAELRGHKLGAKFRRQGIIQGWIVDFWCPSHSLVIEVDGPIHFRQKARDEYRDASIKRLGIRILRFENALIETDISSALACIRQALA